MRKIIILVHSNIRDNKGQSASLMVLIFISALLLNLGLLILINFTNSFDLKAEQLNSPNVNILMPESVYKDSYLTYLDSYTDVIKTQLENILIFPIAGFKYGDGSQSKGVVVMNEAFEREVMKVSFVGETLPANEHSIYVPYLLLTGGGYKLSDDFILTYAGVEYKFQIAGFTEDIVFSTINSSEIGFYMPEEAYCCFIDKLGDDTVKGVMISILLKEQSNAAKMISDFMENQISPEDFSYVSIKNIETVRSARTLTAGIGSMIIVAIAVIIIFICLIVIRFRIDNSIEDGMANIGALKACGYTSRQIMGFITLQFCLLAFISTVLGITISYFTIPLISESFSVQSGLIWEQGFDLGLSIFCLYFILLVVSAVSWFCTRRINQLHPIIALRRGLGTHSFRTNRFPLDKTKGNLNGILSLKRIVQNPKQHLSIALIIASVSFVAVVGLIMYNNFVINDGAIRLIIGERCDVQLNSNLGTESNTLLTYLKEVSGVRKVIYYDYTACIIEYQEILAYITEDFNKIESDMLYEGRHPKHNNEVAFNGYLAELLGKKIGDTVIITMGSEKAEYLLTGLFQTSNYLGMDIEMTIDGVKRLQPDFQNSSIFIYLSDDKDVKVFIDELKNLNDQRISNIQDFEEYIGTFMSSYASIVSILVIVVMIIIMVVIMLILYLVIKTMILHDKRIFGIQKAVGYTTWQLMQQISLTFLPIVSVGVIIGGIIGYFATNPLLSVAFKSIGIMKVSFVISPLWIVALSVGILLFAYVVSMLVSWRIRKISAYALISEV